MLYVLLAFALIGPIGLYWMFHCYTVPPYAEVPWSGDVRANISDGMNAELVLLSAAAHASTARAIEPLPPASTTDGSPSDDYILCQWDAEDSSHTEWAAATPNECIVPMM